MTIEPAASKVRCSVAWKSAALMRAIGDDRPPRLAVEAHVLHVEPDGLDAAMARCQ
jgi:hypothetical protein